MRHRVVLALGAAMLVGLLAGCGAGSSSSTDAALPGRAPSVPGNSAVGGGSSSGQSGSSPSAKGSGSSGGSGTSAVLPSASTGRQVIRTATVAMNAKNLLDTVNKAEQAATVAGGYLSAENMDGESASITLSVPQDRLDSVLAALPTFGTITSQQQQSQDVTGQLVDVASRIATQQASVGRVRQLLAQATSVSDIVSIEGELTTREADLESLEHQQAELTSQVAMSTVTVQITRINPLPTPSAGPPAGFTNGLSGGWHALGDTVRVAALVIGAALPFLLGIGIPVLVVLWLLRRRRKGGPVGPSADTTTAG